MSLRFTANVASGYTNAENFMYDAFYFLTSASPLGPGWVSVGEADGTSGGMGVTGLITSASSLTSGYAWFVVERPDGGSQFLLQKDSGSAAPFYTKYSKGALYTGGDATTAPTATDEMELGTSHTCYGNYFNGVADDEAPYGFAIWKHDTSTIDVYNGLVYIPMDTYETIDEDRYICCTGVPGTYNIFEDLNAASGSFMRGCFGWDPQGIENGEIGMLSVYQSSGLSWPNNPPADVNGNPVLIDSIFCNPIMTSPACWKGTSNFIRWADTSIANGTRAFSGAYIKINQVWIPWNNTALL